MTTLCDQPIRHERSVIATDDTPLDTWAMVVAATFGVDTARDRSDVHVKALILHHAVEARELPRTTRPALIQICMRAQSPIDS